MRNMKDKLISGILIFIMILIPGYKVSAVEQGNTESEYILNYIYMENTEVCQYIPQVIGAEIDYIEDNADRIRDIRLGYTVNDTALEQSYEKQEASVAVFEVPSDIVGEYTVNYVDIIDDQGTTHLDFNSEEIAITDATYQVVEDYLGIENAEYDDNDAIVEDGAISEHDIQIDAEQMQPVGADGTIIVVLDPGHCSLHPGASGNGYREEELTLKIAKYCKEELEQYNNVKVYMTRNDGGCLDPSSSGACLRARSAYAASVHANILVSIHIDAGSSVRSGAMVIVAKKGVYRDDLANITQDLGNSILAELTKVGLSSRGLYIRMSDSTGDDFVYPNGAVADYYSITRNCIRNGIPGIIVEHCYISNPSDVANFLSSDEKLKALGVADATGIAQYYNLSKISNIGEVLYDTSEEAYQVEDHNIPDFVALLYSRVLDRTPSKAEVSYWVRKVELEKLTGSQLTARFVNSKEFQLRNYSDDEYVEKLYEIYMGRTSDAEGKAHWLDKLHTGMTRIQLNDRFGTSKEFEYVCASYGMAQGGYEMQYRKLYPQIAEFVTPYYRGFLNREPDEEGLEHWCKYLIQGGNSAELTRRFVNSAEFKLYTRTSDEFVEGLYQTYLGRASEPEGKAHWMGMLTTMSYDEQLRVIRGFHGSKEYKMFCDRYGVTVGTL